MCEPSPPCPATPAGLIPDDRPYDLLIIGGGINGTAIARAAALAGERVLLVERDDLAQATSSASTKLIHGGLRYLEHRQFKLVREALAERAILLRTAPHLVRPMEFRLPHAPSMRPWWMVRIGLYLYDLFAAGGGLPRSRAVPLDDAILAADHGTGFSYWDAWVDDSRLVVLNALGAAEAGADIQTRTRFVDAVRQGPVWRAALQTADNKVTVAARRVVNAAGPWVEQVLSNGLDRRGQYRIRLVRGSHLILRRQLPHHHALILQQPDRRIIFIIPYQGDWTLVGTTDFAVDDPSDNRISAQETAYLLAAANRYLRDPVGQADIVGDFAGIRPLFDDGRDEASAVTRDYRLELDADGPPLLSVFGGKLTTARHLADMVLGRLGINGGDTSALPLPGGDMADFDMFRQAARCRWPFLDGQTLDRLAGAYGTRLERWMQGAGTIADLGIDFGHGLSQREVDYLVQTEWARSSDDILWRRTRLGLRFDAGQVARLDAYLREQAP